MPSIFINTYQLYKKQTNQLAQWLVDTARRCRYPQDDETSENANGEKPRSVNSYSGSQPSSNAKKAANNKKQPQQKQSNSHDQLNSIRVSQFVELAGVIAKKGEDVVIPKTIVAMIRQIIKMRRSISRYYSMQSYGNPDDRDLRADNHKHIHFISRLEDVLKILESQTLPPDTTPQADVHSSTAGTAPKGDSTDDLSNRFSALEVEEPIDFDTDDTASTASVPSSSLPPRREQRHNVVFDASEEEAAEELDFAVFCLFEDLRRIRMFIEQVWKDYKAGKLDLMTASVVTNTAFGFAQNIDADFCQSHPMVVLSDFHNNPIFPLFLANCMAAGQDVNYREQDGDIYNYKMQEVGEFLFLPVYLLLEAFSRVLKPKQIPLAKKGYYGVYNPKADRAKMSYRQKMLEDKIILMEMLPIFCVLGQADHDLFTVDEMTKGLNALYRTKRIPLWLVFASQVFLDITHTLRDHIGDCYTQIKRTAIVTKINMSRIMEAPAHSVNWAKQNQLMVKNTWSFAQDWIMTDGFNRLHYAFYSSNFPNYDSEPHGLLKSHPLLAGTIETSLRLVNRQIGIVLTMGWGSILYVGHLYNALRQSHLLDVEWLDMELFMSIHSAKTLFVGDLPSTIEDCKKRYDLMMGVAVENFAKNKRKSSSQRPVHSKVGPRDWQRDSPVVSTITDRYLTQRGSIAWSVQNIEGIFNELNRKSVSERLQNRWKTSHQMSNLQLLELFRVALVSEYKVLRYDYISMHFRCLDFLRQLRIEIDEDLRTNFGPDYLEREDQLSNLVGYILMAGVMFQRSMTASKSPQSSELGDLPMISKASALMKKTIDSSGDVETKKVL